MFRTNPEGEEKNGKRKTGAGDGTSQNKLGFSYFATERVTNEQTG